MSNRILATKRINKDIKEITKNPIEGIGIASIDNDLMNYVINMRLMNGPYEGYCLQLLLTFSDNYPTKPPKILIYPDQAIDGNYHHHIFQDNNKYDENNHHFKKFCFDLLDNDFMNISEAKTGWNPSYSISSLLLQVQNFISDPDMGGHVPDKNRIDQLMKSMDSYSRTFNVSTEEGIKKIVHTWKNPYPKMFFKNDKKEEKEEKEEKENNKEKDEEKRIQQIKENLNCFMLKVNYIDEPDILLGYPIVRTILDGNRLELFPIPELLTYDGFKAQKELQGYMVEHYFNLNQLKSANNEYYNNWLPAYINKDHYEKNKDVILKSIAEITSNIAFKENQIFQVFPILLNAMIIGMSKGKASLSSAFIKCYFQYILLFKKLCQEFEVDYAIYLNDIYTKIKDNKYIVNKKIIPDIGNFFMVLLFNKVEINSDELKRIYNALFEDFVIRQMFWLFHGEECREHMKNLLLYTNASGRYLKEFEENPNFKMVGLDRFNQDLHDKKIYDEVIDIISKDKGYLDHLFFKKDTAKQQAEIRIKQSFKRLFLECSQEGRQRLKDIISKNLDFQSYFNIQLDNDKYETFNIPKLLKEVDEEKKQNIIKYAFESQKGNRLLLITFFAQKKIEEPGFLENLEKNYGVYLDVDNFIKDMNKKLEEIKNYKDFFEYIGADFNEGKDDLQLIIDSYQKALDKRYIKTFNQGLGNSSSILNNSMYSRNSNSSLNSSGRFRGEGERRRGGYRNRDRRIRSRSRSRSSSRS